MKQSRRPWTRQEDNAVKKVVHQVGLKNWPLVSNLIRQKYNIEGRSGKQCRQRWHNQLNPEVNKMPWTEQEQKLLFQAHKTYRNRWIDISKLFAGRTDNSIKNHFYSTIRRSLRRICKLLGNKNSTSELRNIKPSTLSKIFQYSQMSEQEITKQNSQMVEESRVITDQLLNFARSKPSKTLEYVDQMKMKNLQILITKLNEFSENYSCKKGSFHNNENIKDVNKKNIKLIIIKADDNVSSLIDQSFEVNQNMMNKTQEKKKRQQQKKQYQYDWQQFQNRCLFVKKMLQNQTESKSIDNDAVSIQGQIQNDNWIGGPSQCFSFMQKQQSSVKQDKFITPKTNRSYGFLPYKNQNHRTVLMKEEFETTIDKLKSQYHEATFR